MISRGQFCLSIIGQAGVHPALAEMPSIAELKQKLEGVDVKFVMVSFDEDKNKAANFIARRKLDFEIYFPGRGCPFETSSIPATFIVDKNGKTVFEHHGMADYSTDGFADKIRALAEEKVN